MRSISPYERYGEPSPESDALLREHIFRAGDTLTGLAHSYYNDWRLWRVIADRNGIVDARQIEIGSRLLIPRKPLQQGRYEST